MNGGFFVKHIKSHSYDIVRLVIDQLGISVFALVLYISMSIAGENNAELGFALNILASVFSIGFYFALLYSVVWEIGAKDRIRIDSGKAEKFGLKGALLGFAANIVNIVFAVFVIIGELLRNFADFDSLNGVIAVVIVIIRFTSAMFLRLVNAICMSFGGGYDNLYQSVIYLMFFILTVGVCHFGYTLGMNNFKLSGNKAKK